MGVSTRIKSPLKVGTEMEFVMHAVTENTKSMFMFKSCQWDILCNESSNWNDSNNDMKWNPQCSNCSKTCNTSSKWNQIYDRKTKQDKCSVKATTEMICNSIRDWIWNLWCRWKLKWETKKSICFLASGVYVSVS